MASRHSIAAALVLLALGATGCGRSADRDQVRDVAERFFAAIESGDGAAACEQLSPDTRDQLEAGEEKPCREAIGSLRLEPAPPARVEVFITNAKVDLPGGESAFLTETAEGWRLSAVGCRPEQGDPAQQPFDCELEA